ncbi:senescence-associated protein AAF, chlorolplastic-like isoform X2 [Andrographis paniculata]|uniref:senescence-associated protein AAF, chlorolplastic-like isoform X2 n=1 Tax=Andrographis paniculata TaxID=175694 RepID=UPI0021E952B6|nr:senescence-associated protein AAF, chlorolplastic-like isoform X2 [Andrographis paniculata]
MVIWGCSPSCKIKTMAQPTRLVCKSLQHPNSYTAAIHQGANHHKKGNHRHIKLSQNRLWQPLGGTGCTYIGSKGSFWACQSTETHNAETREHVRHYSDCSNISSQSEDDHSVVGVGKIVPSRNGLAQAHEFACNDAKFVNERAKDDIVLLSRSIARLDARARQDVAFLGSEFLKLDARAREDVEKIDYDVKRKAERLRYITTLLKNEAQDKLRTAADKHWSDGALEADLKLADVVAKRRAMEDSLMALEFVKNIHDMMVKKIRRRDSTNTCKAMSHITLEKNGETLDFIPGEVSPARISAIEEAYRSIASALSEADGIDYADPEELELVVATLIDLDAMDGKSTVSLLAECSNSSDVRTRHALANALSAAPSMWTLGNAGMGALQRLANDSNPAIAAAVSKTILELKKQWEIQEGDTWRFMMNEKSNDDDDEGDDNEMRTK